MSNKLLLRVAKLIPYPQKHKTLPSLAFVYHFEPPVDDNHQLGSFLVVIEVMGKQALASQIIDQIIKTIGEKYYNEEYSGEPAERFEKALAEVNKNIADLLKSKHAEIARKISAVIAIANTNELHVTRCGKAAAYLYRGGEATNITAELDEISECTKLFSDIISGNLEAKDKILLATPAVFFQFPKADIKQLIEDNSPNTAVAKMSSTLANQDNANRCGAIVLEALTHQMAAEETLPDEPEEAMAGTATTAVTAAKEIARPVGQKALDNSKKIARGSVNWTKDKAVPKVKEHAKRGWNHVWTNYINPNPKLAAVIATVVAVALIGLFVLISQGRSASSDSMASFKEAVALTDSAEAKLSLGDKTTADEALKSATAKLTTLEDREGVQAIDKAIAKDKDLKNRSITFESLQAKISQLNDKVDGIVRINPELVLDYTTNKSASIGPVAYLNDKVYVVNTADGSLHEINPANKSDQKIGSSDGLKNSLSAISSYSHDAIFILTNQPGVIQYKNGKLSDAKLSAGVWEQGTDIASYTSNLYVLSPTTKQVYRHTKTGSGFGAKTSYIKIAGDANLESASSLVVNGSVIVGDKDGNISLFYNGAQKGFLNQGLPPDLKLGEIKKMIWDDKNKQLLVLSKDGQKITALSLDDDAGASYIKQYAIKNGSPTLTSFSIDENNGTIYAVSGKKVIKFKQ